MVHFSLSGLSTPHHSHCQLLIDHVRSSDNLEGKELLYKTYPTSLDNLLSNLLVVTRLSINAPTPFYTLNESDNALSFPFMAFYFRVIMTNSAVYLCELRPDKLDWVNIFPYSCRTSFSAASFLTLCKNFPKKASVASV